MLPYRPRLSTARHETHYDCILDAMEGREGVFTRPIVTLLTGSTVTLEHFDEIYDYMTHTIRRGCWNEPWNTEWSRTLIAVAMMLYGDLAAPEAASGTMAACIVDALFWSDEAQKAIDELHARKYRTEAEAAEKFAKELAEREDII